MSKTYYDNVVLLDTPTAYWRLDESAGVTATDLSGNSLSGAYTPNSGSWTGGTLNQALLPGDGTKCPTFNGSSGIVSPGSPASLISILNAWTMEAWINPAGSQAQAAIISQQFGVSVPWELAISPDGSGSANKVGIGFYNGSWHVLYDSAAVVTSTAYHYVATWDGTTLILYRNGAAVATSTPGASESANNGTQQVRIGEDHSAGHFWNGGIGRVAIYGSAISATSVANHYTAMTAPPSAGGISLSIAAITAGATVTFTAIKNGGTAWGGGSSPITVNAGVINSQTVNATDQTVSINYTAPSSGAFVVFTNNVSGLSASAIHVSGTPTGEVIAIGVANGGTPGSFSSDGNVVSNVFDGDLTTQWDAPDANGDYAYVDLGVAAIPTAVRICPTYVVGDTTEKRAQGSTIKGSNVSATASLTTILSNPLSGSWFRRSVLNERAIVGSAAYRYLVYVSSDSGYGSINELQFIVQANASIPSRPVPPTISPCGGRWPTAAAQRVTLATRTTSASIYYTTDGTTPVVTNGIAQGTTTLYTAVLSITPLASSATVIKAIAYDVNCSTAASDVTTSGTFLLAGFVPNMKLNDALDNRLVSAWSGEINYYNGVYSWIGQMMDVANSGSDVYPVGFFQYTSRDLYNWSFNGQATGLGLQRNVDRPHRAYRPSTGNWVLWAHDYDSLDTNDRAAVWTGPTVNGPWTFSGDVNPQTDFPGLKDCNLFTDTDGTVYAVYVEGTQTAIIISPLSADGLSCVAGVYVRLVSAGRESPVLCKNSSGNYFLITSLGNFYDSATLPMSIRYATGTGGTTPLNATWTGLSTGNPWPGGTDPALNTGYNAQPTCVLKVPGRDGIILMMDWWNASPLSSSGYTFAPMTFPTPTTLALATPASWDLSLFRLLNTESSLPQQRRLLGQLSQF